MHGTNVVWTNVQSPLTFSNGLTLTSNSVYWGGALTQTTNIDLDGNDINYNNTGAAAKITSDVDMEFSASVGVAMYPDHGETSSTLLHCADQLMYQAKEKGKNQISTAPPMAESPAPLMTNKS